MDGAASGDRRTTSASARLARLGFVDSARAATLLHSGALDDLVGNDEFVASLAATADPDQALLALIRVVEAADAASTWDAAELRAALAANEQVRERLFDVLGVSLALGDHLVRHPDHWRDLIGSEIAQRPTREVLRHNLLAAVGAPDVAVPFARAATDQELDDLRAAYRRGLLGIAVRDVHHQAPLHETAEDLAYIADAALEAGLAIARAEVGPDAATCLFAVIGMGKCGGRELNYISDVDVIFVAEPATGADESDAMAVATRLASSLMRNCSTSTSEGSLWEVDAALRPEGKSGVLVRSLASHAAYYDKWASTWEFQALLKARPVAGDAELGEKYVELVSPLVWSAASRPQFVEDVQAMRRRVEEHIPNREADRQLKLGPGGLRDVEFSVQLLQLVHGRDDFRLRSSRTLDALEALSTHGFVGREDAAELDHAYRFLRTLEHRIQLHRLRRTHLVPEGEGELRRLGRSMGMRTDSSKELTLAWRRHQREVRRLHEKLFYRPLLNAVARLEPGQARLTLDAAGKRLEALGYADPAGALRHIDALISGVSRRSVVQRALLPVMLGWFAESPDPDAGLLAFRQVSDALGSTPWYLRLLRDEGAAAERMARVLATSRYTSDLLLRAPEASSMFGDADAFKPRDAQALIAETRSAVMRYDNPEDSIGAARAVRRRELLRTGVADVLGLSDVDAVTEALSLGAKATVDSGLLAAVRHVESVRGGPLPTRFAVIAMGRFGGRELGYGSDADVLFVHDPLPGVDEQDAGEAALHVANELTRLLALQAPDPPLLIDADLRPEGRQGPLVRTIASYAAYYARWSLVWESQALLRAEPVAGDHDLGAEFMELINPLRYPLGGISDDDIREIRRIKARVESERLPRGADPNTHTKLGPGGLADVEWTVQLLQLCHAAEHPALQTTSTLVGLTAASHAGLISDDDAQVLAEAWRTATRVRNAVMLVRGRASDSLPTQARELAQVASVAGIDGGAGGLVDDYRRITRRARAVVERVFYG